MVRLLRVTTIRNVPVLVHWTVPALCFFFLGAGLPRILMVAAALSAYLGCLMVHELGHHFAAVRRGYHVDRIEVFPLHAICRFEHPEYQYDHVVIAWAGPLAQLTLAAPFTAYILVFGFTPWQTANALLAIVGYINPLIALLNLVPVEPLDGKIAWSANPLRVLRAFRRVRPRLKPTKTALEVFEEARTRAIGKSHPQ